MAEIEGVDLVVAGMEDLEVAKTAAAIGVAEVTAGASDLTRAADAAVGGKRRAAWRSGATDRSCAQYATVPAVNGDLRFRLLPAWRHEVPG